MPSTFRHIAPLGTADAPSNFAGRSSKKPWEFGVSCAIPHINTIESLELCIELLRAQTERPYIMVVDTGSPYDVCEELRAMRAEDLEVHFIAGHGYRHSSECVSAALDLSQSICRSEILFQTHTDVFLKRRDFIETYSRLCNANTPVLGYRMSPRDWVKEPWKNEWSWMVGHTASFFYMPTIHRIGATWSMARGHYQFQVPWQCDVGWPDTEVAFNYALREAGIKPVFIGRDTNYERFQDDSIDHVRSFPGSQIYVGGEHREERATWMQDALKDGRARLKEWQSEQ